MINPDKTDLYNLDITLARIIHTYLVAFRDMERHGVIYEQDGEDKTDWLLEELIWTFETISNENTTPEIEELSNEIYGVNVGTDYRLKTLRDHPKYSLYAGMLRRNEKRISNGLELFSKYFRSLWD